MAEAASLSQRIKAEFDARTQRQKAAEQQKTKESDDREKRLAKFNTTCEELKAVWGPKLQEFAKQFGSSIKMTPSVTPSQREVKVIFLTDMATMNLTISAAPSPDVTKFVLDYDLLIIPIFFDYERHARLEMPLEKVDKSAAGKWLDDQLVSCVKAYLSMQENEIYIKRSMVEDPVTKEKLRREDAKAKLEHEGKTYYFGSEESFRKFKQERAGGAAAEPKPSQAAKDGAGAGASKAAAKPAPAKGK